MIEVGTKKLTKGDKKEAKNLFAKAYDLYSLFWGINLRLIDIGNVKKIHNNQINKNNDNKKDLTKRLNKLVRDLIDCCKE